MKTENVKMSLRSILELALIHIITMMYIRDVVIHILICILTG